jgi:hypothetical protein
VPGGPAVLRPHALEPGGGHRRRPALAREKQPAAAARSETLSRTGCRMAPT